MLWLIIGVNIYYYQLVKYLIIIQLKKDVSISWGNIYVKEIYIFIDSGKSITVVRWTFKLSIKGLL